MSVVRRISAAPVKVQRRVRDARSTRWDDHRAVVKAELVDAAIRAIEKFGDAVSMDDFAEEAGASKPKLYRHFGDRAGLYSAVAARLGSMMWESAQSTLLSGQADSTVDELFRSAVSAYVSLVDEHPAVVRFLMTNHMFQYSESGEGGAADQLRSAMEIISDEFARGLREVDAEESPVAVAVASILGAGLSATQWWIDHGRQNGMSRDMFAAHLCQTSWGIIDGAAATVGVRFHRDRSLGDPGFATRLDAV
ncbi:MULTISPECIES: TetR/AcrR family transcriptional regulator [unclassified Gordonia (in: high G+C Gram-positive bacteria)]|uniref:TetR/AcrR family transcriptional regulator n=1 Tax=unclassified Gordonia (in: high G+C Gram-positive bacteria) TaxID=2657482 RepID=UPI00071D10B8|nr:MULTISPECIES: TetR/AcrR family transcriptional regulator [unclassified Gordonia (in: high G+C Gram-positive bacteria)]KSU51556.1 transcriptional regulator [Gordonia sp. SGD-V-85]SCC59756.1 transcriptional regulator, TetR family [Gordonia sp. v-85]